MILYVFDIDGTLITSGGVGGRAFNHAGRVCFGVEQMFKGVALPGSIDPQIVGRGLALRGIPPTARRIGRIKKTYLRQLRRTMPAAPGRIMAGAPEAVQASRRAGEVALLTGNWRAGAQVKLAHFGLWAPFEPVIGAFGDDAARREELVPVAWARARRRGLRPSQVIVIGDTVADVACARAGAAILSPWGVRVHAVAVETGLASPEALRAARPDLQIPDLVRGLPALLQLGR